MRRSLRVALNPVTTHPLIVHPLALTVGAHSGGREFADFLRTPPADAVFVKCGFAPLQA